MNESWNQTDDPFGESRGHRRMIPQMAILQVLKIYISPVISLSGMALNLFTFIVILKCPLRKCSAMIYIASQAVVEAGHHFYVSLLYLQPFYKVMIMNREWVCQFSTYFEEALLFLSIWYLVAFAVDHLLQISAPARRREYCTAFRAKLVVISFAIIAIYGHIYYTWFYSTSNRFRLCTMDDKYHTIGLTLTRLNTGFTILLPYAMLVVLYTTVAYVDIRDYRQRHTVVDANATVTPNDRNDKGRLNSKRITRPDAVVPSLPKSRTNVIFYVIIVLTIIMCLPFKINGRIFIFQRNGRMLLHDSSAVIIMQIFDFSYNLYFLVKPIVYFSTSPLIRHYSRARCQRSLQCEEGLLERGTGSSNAIESVAPERQYNVDISYVDTSL